MAFGLPREARERRRHTAHHIPAASLGGLRRAIHAQLALYLRAKGSNGVSIARAHSASMATMFAGFFMPRTTA